MIDVSFDVTFELFVISFCYSLLGMFVFASFMAFAKGNTLFGLLFIGLASSCGLGGILAMDSIHKTLDKCVHWGYGFYRDLLDERMKH